MGWIRPRTREEGDESDDSRDGSNDEVLSLHIVALNLWQRYHELGDLNDLEEAIRLGREAFARDLKLRSTETYASVGNLGVSLADLYAKTGQADVIEEAVRLTQLALDMITAPGHTALPRAKVNLANALRGRFKASGDVRDLDRAIELCEEGLRETPLDHPVGDIELRQNALARGLLARGLPDDVSRAMSLLTFRHAPKESVRSADVAPSDDGNSPPLAYVFEPLRTSEPGLPGNQVFVSSQVNLLKYSPPAARDLTGQVFKVTEFPSGLGGFADVYLGEWKTGQRNRVQKVAIKVLRGSTMDPLDGESQRIQKRLRSEIRLWSGLDHPNVIKLYGTCDGFGPHASMICPWYANGNIPTFLRSHKSLVYSERLRLIREVAEGLAYLHANAIIHGDLTGPNVLIDNNQHACLSDFGLSVLARDLELTTTSQVSTATGGNARWAAPELYAFNTGPPALTFFCDVYSFGSVTLEIFSGNIPYHYVEHDLEVLLRHVVVGCTPQRPRGLREKHWAAIEQCWLNEPKNRPPTRSLSGLFEE